jgi:small-conductance mechanosensitive channel
MPKSSIGPFISQWHGVIVPLAWLLAAVFCGLLAYRLIFFLYGKIDKNPGDRAQLVFRECRAPLRFALPIYAIDIATSALHLSGAFAAPVSHLLGLLEIIAIAWLAIKLAFVLSESLVIHYEALGGDDFKTRRIVTQIRLLRRILLAVISVLACGVALMSFRWGRELGGSVLASAGIAGLAVGLAARPTIENLVAGFQLAITQPIRIEDVVIVENEWGWIEEITTTYVVVRIWDLRRLVLPLSYFISHPFQNWTRNSANLMGSAHVYADYSVPVDEVRSELARIVKTLPDWDGHVCVLQVTHATDRALELRALVSASDSGKLWNLRCAVRERLIAFIQRQYPHCLPRMRAEAAMTRADGFNGIGRGGDALS